MGNLVLSEKKAWLQPTKLYGQHDTKRREGRVTAYNTVWGNPVEKVNKHFVKKSQESGDLKMRNKPRNGSVFI